MNPGDSTLTGEFLIASEWDTAYNVTFTVKNSGDNAVNNWRVQFSSNDEIANIWCADITSHEDGIYMIENAAWNGTIAAGESVTFGFVMNKSETLALEPKDIQVVTVG